MELFYCKKPKTAHKKDQCKIVNGIGLLNVNFCIYFMPENAKIMKC